MNTDDMEHPVTFRELMRYVRTSGPAVQIRFAVIVATIVICAAAIVALAVFR